MSNRPLLRVVLPKEGRLKRDVAALLSAASLGTSQAHPRHDYGVLFDIKREIPPLEFITQRPFDALDTVACTAAEIAIVGFDMLREFSGVTTSRGETNLVEIAATFHGVSACALYIAGPIDRAIRTPHDLNASRIATAYPASTRQWLRDTHVSDSTIITRQGSVEDTVRLQIADVISDLVNSGESLRLNGLSPYFRIYESTAVAVKRTGVNRSPVANAFLNRLVNACLPSTTPVLVHADIGASPINRGG
jgi:ATP phosphoribosyltransferase